MILTAFRLARDPNTEGQSFGYQHPFWPEDKRNYGHFTPALGCPIAVDTRLVPNIVKIVEYHQHTDGPVVVERLAWAFGKQLYAYRAKYIRQANVDYVDNTVMFLANMGGIYKQLTGIDTLFASPLRFYINTAAQAPWHNPESRDYIYDMYQQHSHAIDGLATQATDWYSMREFLSFIEADAPRQVIESCFHNFFLPKLPFCDPLSMRAWYRPMHVSELTFQPVHHRPYDTSEVPELTINHPEVTVYSPVDYHKVAEYCEYISRQFTDVKLEYILSGRVIVQEIVHHQVSRYRVATKPQVLNHTVGWIITDVLAKLPYSKGTEFVITFQLTYGDEVLIEVYTSDRRRCLHAVHLDLALLAFCASGVIIESPPL